MAPVASWTTIRRPVLSSRLAGAVTTASIATSRPFVRSAVEIGITVGVAPEARGDASEPGVAVGAAVSRVTS